MTEPPTYKIYFTNGEFMSATGWIWEGRDGSVRFYRKEPGLGLAFLIVGSTVLHHVELVEEEE